MAQKQVCSTTPAGLPSTKSASARALRLNRSACCHARRAEAAQGIRRALARASMLNRGPPRQIPAPPTDEPHDRGRSQAPERFLASAAPMGDRSERPPGKGRRPPTPSDRCHFGGAHPRRWRQRERRTRAFGDSAHAAGQGGWGGHHLAHHLDLERAISPFPIGCFTPRYPQADRGIGIALELLLSPPLAMRERQRGREVDFAQEASKILI